MRIYYFSKNSKNINKKLHSLRFSSTYFRIIFNKTFQFSKHNCFDLNQKIIIKQSFKIISFFMIETEKKAWLGIKIQLTFKSNGCV